MNKEYLRYLATSDITSLYAIKSLLLLHIAPATQTMIANMLHIKKQNISHAIKELKRLGLVEVDRIEGKNKFYRPVTDMKKLNDVIPGQLNIEQKQILKILFKEESEC